MTYQVRSMRKQDIGQVTEIDCEAFPTQLPPPNYHHELQGRLNHYIVVCDKENITDRPEAKTASKESSGPFPRLRQFLNRFFFFNNGLSPSDNEYILGFVGFWLLAEEAHITSIAVREAHHRKGLGKLLLISGIDLAAKLKARTITLEVRASNTTAQSLYAKYGFTHVGLRRSYYIDNREDAVLMSTPDITSASFQIHLEQLRESCLISEE